MTSLRYQNQLSYEQREKVIQYFLIAELLLNQRFNQEKFVLPNSEQSEIVLNYQQLPISFAHILQKNNLSLLLTHNSTLNLNDETGSDINITSSLFHELLHKSKLDLISLVKQFKNRTKEFSQDLNRYNLNQYSSSILDIFEQVARQLPFTISEINPDAPLYSELSRYKIPTIDWTNDSLVSNDEQDYVAYQHYIADIIIAKLNLSQLFNAYESLTRVVNQWLNQQKFYFTAQDNKILLTELAQKNYATNSSCHILPISQSHNFPAEEKSSESYENQTSFSALNHNLIFTLEKSGYEVSIARPLISNLLDIDLSPLLKQEIDSLTNRKRGAGATNNHDHEIKTLIQDSLDDPNSAYQTHINKLTQQKLNRVQELEYIDHAANYHQMVLDAMSAGINLKVTKFLLEFATTIINDCDTIADFIQVQVNIESQRSLSETILSKTGEIIAQIIFYDPSKINSTPPQASDYRQDYSFELKNAPEYLTRLEQIKNHWLHYLNLTARKNLHTNLLQLQRRIGLENIFCQVSDHITDPNLDIIELGRELQKLEQEKFDFYLAGKNNFALNSIVEQYYQEIIHCFKKYCHGEKSYHSDLTVIFEPYWQPSHQIDDSELLTIPDLILKVTSIYTPANLKFIYCDTVVLGTPETFKRILTSGLSLDNNELNLQVFLNRPQE